MWEFDSVANILPWTPIFLTGMPSSNQTSLLTLVARQSCLKYLSSCYLCGRFGWYSRLPASAWSSPGRCGHSGQWINRWKTPLPVFLSNTTQKKRTFEETGQIDKHLRVQPPCDFWTLQFNWLLSWANLWMSHASSLNIIAYAGVVPDVMQVSCLNKTSKPTHHGLLILWLIQKWPKFHTN